MLFKSAIHFFSFRAFLNFYLSYVDGSSPTSSQMSYYPLLDFSYCPLSAYIFLISIIFPISLLFFIPFRGHDEFDVR